MVDAEHEKLARNVMSAVMEGASSDEIRAKAIDAKVDAELKRVAPQIKMPGFRPGKVPTNLVKKMHGPAI